ncbi:MAG: threonine--tRNA ligase [Planctomycetes bacterium]|nr:threonine--tRNA ligase [Planctomycetota bacterium]
MPQSKHNIKIIILLEGDEQIEYDFESDVNLLEIAQKFSEKRDDLEERIFLEKIFEGQEKYSEFEKAVKKDSGQKWILINEQIRKWLKDVIGAKVVDGQRNIDGEELEDGSKLVDVHSSFTNDAKIWILSKYDETARRILRHSGAHIMAQAVNHLFGPCKFWVGPAIEDGFYYDIDCEHKIEQADLKKIEKEMMNIVKQRLPFVKKLVSKEEALEQFKHDEYKADLISGLVDKQISFYSQGDFTDLCRGPHLPNTGYLKAFKVMKFSGAYWKGDADNKMLQRLYGTAFFDKGELKEHLDLLKEAEERDHRKLGKELDLFSFSEYAPSMPTFHPKGVWVVNKIVEVVREQLDARGYIEIMTPQLMNEELWKISGHADNYADDMYYVESSGQKMALKPMNCPGAMLWYKTKHHSYTEFPLRVTEFGKVHRQEKSGVVHGLLRVKSFVQDDAHIFCEREQIVDEVLGMIDFIEYIYKVFGFEEVHYELSTRPKKSIGADEDWKAAEIALREALDIHQKNNGITWRLNPEDGAFYGPKIDVHITDALKRNWQLGTIQVDFSLPKRFKLNYMTKEGVQKEPIMLHRTIVGSLERFFGLLIEQHKGAFPFWLHPVQVKVLPITTNQNEYAEKLLEELKAKGFRAEADLRSERLNRKIREAATYEKVPYLLIVGDNEANEGKVSVRVRGTGKDADKGVMTFVDFLTDIESEQ